MAQAYGRCAAPVAMIVGPIGGGKTTESVRRYLRVASWQHPSPIDGVRKARVLCICPTYRRAWDQIIPSFFGRLTFPQSGPGASFKGARGDPADFTFDCEINTGREVRRLHLEVLFRAVNDLDIEDFFRGFLFTAIHLPEADTNGDLAQILSLGSTRVGRYPEPHDRPDQADTVAYKGIWGDANAPIIGSAFHERFYMKRLQSGLPAPATDRLFRQPSGFSMNAENPALRKIDPDYYVNQAKQFDPYDVRRMIESRPSFGRHGQPVHPNFDDQVHVAKHTMTPDPSLDVFIGIDAGSNALTPGATFSQRASGQWRKFAEIALPKGEQLNTQDFGEEILRVLNARFPKRRTDAGAVLCLDPAASSGNAATGYSTAHQLQGITQIEAQPAPSNKPNDRRGVTDALFKRFLAPGEPAILIDPDCRMLIGGYTGGFHYPRFGQRTGLIPAKNEFSHVCEADEYTHLTADGPPAGPDGFIRLGGSDANTSVSSIDAF